jgi:hypothetical protein
MLHMVGNVACDKANGNGQSRALQALRRTDHILPLSAEKETTQSGHRLALGNGQRAEHCWERYESRIENSMKQW